MSRVVLGLFVMVLFVWTPAVDAVGGFGSLPRCGATAPTSRSSRHGGGSTASLGMARNATAPAYVVGTTFTHKRGIRVQAVVWEAN